MGPNHLSWLELGEARGLVDDQFPNSELFRVEAIPDYLEEIAVFLVTSKFVEGYKTTQRRQMVAHTADYQLIIRQLYRLGIDQILRRVFLIMRDMIYCGNFIQELWVGILVGRPLQGKCCRPDSRGPHFSEMKRSMPRDVMFVKGLESHHTRMNFLCN